MTMKRTVSNISMVFLLTASAIMFQIGLSRMFSYMLSYHFVLIIIAFSILGIGIGQLLFSKYQERLEQSIGTVYLLMPISMLFSFSLLIALPKVALFSSGSSGLASLVILSVLPFLAIGTVHAFLFQKNKHQASLLYGFDLFGAAIGALLSVLLLNSFSLFLAIGIAISLLLLAYVLHTYAYQLARRSMASASFGGFVLLLWLAGGNMSIDVSIANDPSKDMLRLMNNPMTESEIIASQWNSFGKTDLVKFRYPDNTETDILFIDGAAGTVVANIDELLQDTVKMMQELTGFPAILALDFLDKNEKDTALVIGPGGGIDLAATWLTGFKFIEGVEVNPSFVELMKTYNRPTFSEKENIKVHVGEGRNFVRDNKDKYDAIMLTIPVTKGGRGADFYGLTENYLFTVEALGDYLDALTAEGAIFFTMHGRNEVYKMLSNYLELQNQQGVSAKKAFEHVYIYSNGMNPVMVIQNRPLDKEKTEAAHLAVHELRLDGDVLFFPYIEQISINNASKGNIDFNWYMFDNLLYDISNEKYPYSNLWEASLLNLRPAFDDKPFFFNYTSGIPDALSIPVWLGIAILIWFLYKSATGWKLEGISSVSQSNKFRFLAALVFVLGFSYFFVQAYLFQILNLKLSNPSQSFSLLLFTFLLGNGAGSLLTNKFKKALPKKVVVAAASIIGVCLLTVFALLPFLYDSLSEFGIAAILLLPSFFVGIPFPIFLKIAAKHDNKNAVPILLAVSSVAGVAASVFAISISILYGYKFVFLAGLAGYALIVIGALRLGSIENKIEIATKIKSLPNEMVTEPRTHIGH